MASWVSYLQRQKPLDRPWTIGSDCTGAGAIIEVANQLGEDYHVNWLCETVGKRLDFAASACSPKPRLLLNDMLERRYVAGGFVSEQMKMTQSTDVYVCGFPCTPFSYLGKQLRWHDQNSLPFFEAAKSIVAIRPAVVVLENTTAVLHKDASVLIENVLQTVPRYKWKWETLTAANFGLPQTRSRVYIIGCNEDRTSPDSIQNVRSKIASFIKRCPEPKPLLEFLSSEGVPMEMKTARGGKLRPCGSWHCHGNT